MYAIKIYIIHVYVYVPLLVIEYMICDFYRFKLVPTDTAFKNDLNGMRYTLIQKKNIDFRKYLNLCNDHTQILVKTNDIRKNNTRYFR